MIMKIIIIQETTVVISHMIMAGKMHYVDNHNELTHEGLVFRKIDMVRI